MSKDWSAGELDRRVVLQTSASTRDPATRAELRSWSDVATLFARVREQPVPARGAAADPAVASSGRPSEVVIRWREGLDKSVMRLRIGSRILRIVGVAEVGRRYRLRLAVEEWAHE